MPKKDFSKTIIYMIVCKNKDIQYKYVGSTTKLRQMTMIHHKRTAEPKQELPYTIINEHGGWENWEVVVLEHYTDCQNIIQSNNRVKEWQTKIVSQKSTESPPISTESPQKRHTCQYCSNSYSRSDSLKRHINRCKKKPNDNLYENRLEKLEKIIEQLMEQNKQLLEKDKTKSKIVNNVINNGTINNNTYKLELGNENILEKLSEKQKKEILNKMHDHSILNNLVFVNVYLVLV